MIKTPNVLILSGKEWDEMTDTQLAQASLVLVKLHPEGFTVLRDTKGYISAMDQRKAGTTGDLIIKPSQLNVVLTWYIK